MKLYHFTNEKQLPSIHDEGLTLGVIPVRMGSQFTRLGGFQWLTATPEPVEAMGPEYDIRLTIVVPKKHQHKLLDHAVIWRDFGTFLGSDFLEQPEFKNWYLFTGRVKPGWIREMRRVRHESVA